MVTSVRCSDSVARCELDDLRAGLGRVADDMVAKGCVEYHYRVLRVGRYCVSEARAVWM